MKTKKFTTSQLTILGLMAGILFLMAYTPLGYLNIGPLAFKMERQGLIHIGDEVEISEFQSYMNYSYIIEPAVAMSGCYKNSERIKSTHGIIKNIEHTPRGFIVTAEFEE